MKKGGIAVIGLGFGDEGKGRVVDWLCRTHNPDLVVRFSGGQQAGHQVVSEGNSHVFSNFGSGTFAGIPSFFMRYCTVDPAAIYAEYEILRQKDVYPVLYIDGKCPVTTPYDKMGNLLEAKLNGHGTCGLGVGATWQREQDHYSLLMEDILFPSVVRTKLRLIRKYYQDKGAVAFPAERCESIEDTFLQVCNNVHSLIDVRITHEPLPECSLIFEGSQGLMLDPSIGYFPHVTRSTINLSNLVAEGYEPDVYLVTRAYQTRHGAGPMSNEGLCNNISDNPYERNKDDGHQGVFRKSLLDIELLKYAIMKETYLRTHRDKLTLVITCLDLVDNEWRYTSEEGIVGCLSEAAFARAISDELGIKKFLISDSPMGELKVTRTI